MKDQTGKTPLRMPPEFPELGAATLKDECFDVPALGTPEREVLDADMRAYWDAKKAGRIPQYPCFKLSDE